MPGRPRASASVRMQGAASSQQRGTCAVHEAEEMIRSI